MNKKEREQIASILLADPVKSAEASADLAARAEAAGVRFTADERNRLVALSFKPRAPETVEEDADVGS